MSISTALFVCGSALTHAHANDNAPFEAPKASFNTDHTAHKLSGSASANKKQNSNSKLKVTSSKQAANLAKSKFNAKVLSVSKSQSRNGPVYRVKMLSSNGVVFYAIVFAQNGQVVRG